MVRGMNEDTLVAAVVGEVGTDKARSLFSGRPHEIPSWWSKTPEFARALF